MERRGFEELEHTADIAVRVWGPTLADLFANAAYAMACQLTDVDVVRLTTQVEVELEADDVELLLVGWLSELLYLGERDDAVFVQFDIHELTARALSATARGGRNVERGAHIKAVTFSELEVQQRESRYETHIVFDV